MAHKKWFWFSLTLTVLAQGWFFRPAFAANNVETLAHQYELASDCANLVEPSLANRKPAITGSAILSTEFVSWVEGFESKLSNVMQ